jgi:hypothetical protein
MRLITVVLLILAAQLRAGEAIIRTATGDVQVRRGVSEQWQTVVQGEKLAPDATVKIGARSTGVVEVDGKSIRLPAETMVDMSDIRTLTKEELMLKLAMEKVRSSPYEWKENELNTTRTTVTHGADKSPHKNVKENDGPDGQFQMNGTKVLFEHSFYSTCALRSMEVMRRYPRLALVFDHRWRLAESLEKALLTREALNEYKAMDGMEVTPEQRDRINRKIVSLTRAEL